MDSWLVGVVGRTQLDTSLPWLYLEDLYSVRMKLQGVTVTWYTRHGQGRDSMQARRVMFKQKAWNAAAV